MALVIEDGSQVSGATSYATAAQFNTYASTRGKSLSGDNGTVEQLLIKAMDYIETQDFKGARLTKTQALQWPRAGVTLDGFPVEEDEIPDDLIFAQIETALAIDSGTNPLDAQGRTTVREKVGDIEVEYASDAKDSTELVAVNARLEKLISGGSSGATVELSRA